MSIRKLAEKHGVHRRTVLQALAAAMPPRRAYPVRPRPAIDPSAVVIDGWLLDYHDAPKKQRHIAIATDLPFSGWGTVFPDPRLVAAIVDCVTFNAHILETGTQPYRLRTSKTTSRRNRAS